MPEERPTFLKDLRLFILLGVTAIVLLIFLGDDRAGLESALGRIRSFQEKLIQAKDTVRKNRDVLLPLREKVLDPTLLAEKSLRTVIKEATESVGISRNLEAINPGEDRKNGTLKARVVIRNVPLRKIVEFIVTLKNLSAGIRDTDASLRMQGYNVDRWRIDLTLEAPPGIKRTLAKKAATKEKTDDTRTE